MTDLVLDCTDAGPEHVGNVPVGLPFDSAQEKNRSAFVWQVRDDGAELLVQYRRFKRMKRVLLIGTFRRRDVCIKPFTPLSAPRLVANKIAADTANVRRKTQARIKSLPVFPHPDECLLHDVVGGIGIAGMEQNLAEEYGLVVFVQDSEGLNVGGLDLCEERSVFGRVVHCGRRPHLPEYQFNIRPGLQSRNVSPHFCVTVNRCSGEDGR